MIRAKFELSTVPPSVNRSLNPGAKGKGFYKTDESKAWATAAGWELKRQYGRLPEFCYYRTDILIPACQTSQDVGNMSKPIIDLFAKAGRTPDDRYSVDERIRFYGGDVVIVAFREEDLDTWVKIKKPSRLVLKRLRYHSSLSRTS